MAMDPRTGLAFLLRGALGIRGSSDRTLGSISLLLSALAEGAHGHLGGAFTDAGSRRRGCEPAWVDDRPVCAECLLSVLPQAGSFSRVVLGRRCAACLWSGVVLQPQVRCEACSEQLDVCFRVELLSPRV